MNSFSFKVLNLETWILLGIDIRNGTPFWSVPHDSFLKLEFSASYHFSNANRCNTNQRFLKIQALHKTLD